MKREFKHIPTGDIYTQGTPGLAYDDKAFCTNGELVSLKIVTSGKDWLEIAKPEYTILTLWSQTHIGAKISLASYDKAEEGSYNKPLNKIYDTREKWLHYFHPPLWNIYSVRRESDNEIFTIGDYTNGGTILQILQCELEIHGIKKPDFLHIIYKHDLKDSKYPDLKDLQKIQPKEWEITAFTEYIRNRIFTDCKNEQDLNCYLKDPECQIYSVRRLSDNVEFKIGDNTAFGKIKNFYLTNGVITCHVDKSDEDEYLSDLIKKEKLFTTEDGVNIYESDNNIDHKGKRLYQVSLEAGEDSWGDEFEIYNLLILNDYCLYNKGVKTLTFSTKQTAEDYILMNKPCLSIMDIINKSYEGDSNKWGGIGMPMVSLNNMKELVKSKL